MAGSRQSSDDTPTCLLSDWDGAGFGDISFLSSSSSTLFEWSITVKSMNRKWWLALPLLFLPATTACPTEDAAQLQNNRQLSKKNLTVPEGGSSLVYVLAAGVTCLGAMLVRSRSVKPKKS